MIRSIDDAFDAVTIADTFEWPLEMFAVLRADFFFSAVFFHSR